MYKCNQITEDTYYIIDKANDFIYVLNGDKKTLVIDLGETREPILSTIKTIAHENIIVYLTHGHGDHVAKTLEFDTIYLSPLDQEVYQENELFFPEQFKLKDYHELHPLYDNQTIDLGNREIIAIWVGGHSPGSMIFIDEKNHFLFVGDALPTKKGVWVQASHSLTLSEYADNLEKLLAYFDRVGIDDTWEMWSGHEKTGEDVYPHKTSICQIEQGIELCRLLVNGNIVGTPSCEPTFDGTQAYKASYKDVTIIYKDSTLK